VPSGLAVTLIVPAVKVPPVVALQVPVTPVGLAGGVIPARTAAAQARAAPVADAVLACVWALSLWLKNEGMATAERMPMITITISSSTSVKPAWASLWRFLLLCRRWKRARWPSSLAWRREVMG
jgi:hypothetical protein